MSFDCFTAREYEDRSPTIMYPHADAASASILLNSDDGSRVKRATATSVELVHQGKSKRHTQFRLDAIKAEIVVTDSRVAFAIPKYDKGGGWTGGATAIAINAVSKARASIRSRGKCLVGHLHYPWLLAVGHGAAFSLLGKRKHDQLRLGYTTRVNQSKINVWLELDLPRDVSGHSLATEIMVRTVRHRLANNQRLSDEDRAKLESRVEEGLPSTVAQGTWTQVVLPGSFVALESTATYPEPKPDAAEEPELSPD